MANSTFFLADIAKAFNLAPIQSNWGLLQRTSLGSATIGLIIAIAGAIFRQIPYFALGVFLAGTSLVSAYAFREIYDLSSKPTDGRRASQSSESHDDPTRRMSFAGSQRSATTRSQTPRSASTTAETSSSTQEPKRPRSDSSISDVSPPQTLGRTYLSMVDHIVSIVPQGSDPSLILGLKRLIGSDDLNKKEADFPQEQVVGMLKAFATFLRQIALVNTLRTDGFDYLSEEYEDASRQAQADMFNSYVVPNEFSEEEDIPN